jgi:hypothetical protein
MRSIMSNDPNPDELARFAARELLARFEREIGHAFPSHVASHMLTCFELGYLRGRGDGFEHGMRSAVDLTRKAINDHFANARAAKEKR